MNPNAYKSPVDKTPLLSEVAARLNPATVPVANPPENLPDPFIRYPSERVSGFPTAVLPLT